MTIGGLIHPRLKPWRPALRAAWKEFKNPTKRFVAENIYNEMIQNEEQKKIYLNEFKKNIFKNSIVANIASVPGVGKIRAHIIAAFIASPHRFETKHKLWSYAKLVRHRDVSDGYVLRNRTPHGRSELKSAFMGAAQRVMISPAGTALKDYYEHLIDNKGLNAKKARKALARKIAAVCLVIMKKETKYDDKIVRKTFEN